MEVPPNGWFIMFLGENPSINGWFGGTTILGNIHMSYFNIFQLNSSVECIAFVWFFRTARLWTSMDQGKTRSYIFQKSNRNIQPKQPSKRGNNTWCWMVLNKMWITLQDMSQKVPEMIPDPGVMKVLWRQSESHLKSPAQASCERVARHSKFGSLWRVLQRETALTNNLQSCRFCRPCIASGKPTHGLVVKLHKPEETEAESGQDSTAVSLLRVDLGYLRPAGL